MHFTPSPQRPGGALGPCIWRHPKAAAPQVPFRFPTRGLGAVRIWGLRALRGGLDMRVRVLAAMTVARELDAVYVWGAQTGSARRQSVPESTITAIREGHMRGVPAEDAQIIDFTRRLMREHRVDDATAAAIMQRFGDRGLIELTGSIGYYALLAMTVNVCELEAAPGAEVLKGASA